MSADLPRWLPGQSAYGPVPPLLAEATYLKGEHGASSPVSVPAPQSLTPVESIDRAIYWLDRAAVALPAGVNRQATETYAEALRLHRRGLAVRP